MNRSGKSGARVAAVSVSDRKGVKKKNVVRARALAGEGLEGDAHRGPGRRQVSLLAAESTERLARTVGEGRETPIFTPGDFAENLTTRGIELYSLPVGTRLTIGEDVILEISQIGKECHRGCAIRKITGDCVMPREGVFARVIEGGWIKEGDPISVIGSIPNLGKSVNFN